MRFLLFALTAMISIPAALAVLVVHLIAIVIRLLAKRERRVFPKPTASQEADFELRMQEHRFAVANRGPSL